MFKGVDVRQCFIQFIETNRRMNDNVMRSCVVQNTFILVSRLSENYKNIHVDLVMLVQHQ